MVDFRRKLLDLDTGELIELKDGDRLKIITAKQDKIISDYYRDKEKNEEIKWWNEQLGGFVFLLFKYCDALFNDCEGITQNDIVKLFYLATYVDYQGYLVYNDAFMTRQDMRKVLELSRTNFDIFFNKMLNLGIFAYDKNKHIFINKNYFIKGNVEDEIVETYNHTRLYINTIRYLYKHVPKTQHSQLGNYFRLIPYIHRQRNILCSNPDSLPEEANPLTVYDLQQILGCHRNTARKFISDMLKVRLENGEAIVGFWRTDYDEGYSKIIVNPKVFYGGNFNIKGGRQEIIKWFERK